MPDLEITPEFRRTIELVESGTPLIFVTGGAGTGKSTLIGHLRETLKRQIAVAAPTGVAALNIQGATLHSLFRLPPAVVRPEDIKKARDRDLYLKLDLLIIDEISMVRPDVLDGVDRFLRLNRSIRAPFGGLQLIFVGDMFQLPPVVKGEEGAVLKAMGYASEFFFSAHCMEEMEITPVLLKKVFRQRDAGFVKVLNDIRQARNVDEALSVINTRCGPEPGEERVMLTGTNAAAEEINQWELARISEPEITYEGEISGDFVLGRDKLPSPLALTLKKGARVMFTKNDLRKRWVNGTMGIVESIHENYVVVRLRDGESGEVVVVDSTAWEQYRYAYDDWEEKIEASVKGRYKQLPLMPAWAVTIHKAQGKTLPGVYIDLGRAAFAPGQVYVALSRVRGLEDITLKRPVREAEVRVAPGVRAFHEAIEAQKGRSFIFQGRLPSSCCPSPSCYPPRPGSSGPEGEESSQSPVMTLPENGPPPQGLRGRCAVETRAGGGNNTLEDSPPFDIPPKAAIIFNSEWEQKSLKQNGARLMKLMQGELQPQNEKEINFVRVCRGEIKPMTEMEMLWKRYMLMMKWVNV